MEFGLFRTKWTVRNLEVSVRRGSTVFTLYYFIYVVSYLVIYLFVMCMYLYL